MEGVQRSLWWFCVAAMLLANLFVMVSSVKVESILLFLMLSVFWLLITKLGFYATRMQVLYSVIYGTISAYLWFGYAIKLGYLVNFPADSWINEISFLPFARPDDYVGAFIMVVVGLMFLQLGMMAPLVRFESVRKSSLTISFDKWRWVAIFAFATLFLKFYLQVKFDIAKPGVKPMEIPIPFVNGILAFVVGFFLVSLCNVSLFHAMKSKAKSELYLAFFLILGLVISDIWVGYKQAIVFQLVVMAYYFSYFKGGYSKKANFKIVSFGILGLVLGLLLYKYINDYRYALLRGEDVSSAIQSALAFEGGDKKEGAALGFFNRINGVDNFYAAVHVSQYQSFPLSAMFDETLGDIFNRVLYEGEEANTQFGLTQFGALYAVGGFFALVLGSWFLGLFLQFIGKFIVYIAFRSSTWAYAIAPCLALWMVHVLFAGGVLILYFKELALSTTFLFFIYRFFFKKVDLVTEMVVAGRHE